MNALFPAWPGDWLTDFAGFAWPWAWAVLPLPLLLRWLLPPVRSGVAALRIPAGMPLPEPAAHALVGRRQLVGLLAFTAWLLLCAAAARPQLLGAATLPPQQARQMMLAVDLSGSMAENDMHLGGRPVDRLTAAKAVIADFLDRRAGDRVGLLVFGQRAYVMTPLTLDLASLRQQLGDTVAGLAGRETALGDAIGLAVKRLREQPPGQRVLVLLTDGVNTAGVLDPRKAAELAQAEGVRVHTIAFGGSGGGFSLFGLQVPTGGGEDVDEETLRSVAEQTGGRFFRAYDTAELAGIYAELDRLEPVAAAAAPVRPRIEAYPWPLALSAALALLVLLAAGASAMSDWLAMLHFQRPLWLWGLALLPLLALACWWLGRRGEVWRDAVDPHLLPHLLEPARGRRWLAPVLVMLATLFALLALAGPGWQQQAQPQWQSRAPLVIAFDLSSAVSTPDLPPSRLLQARAKLAQLLRQRAGGEVGLVAWADDAFTVAPLTGDAGNVALFIDALSPEVMPVDGQRPARAITHAAALLRQAGFSSGQILLFAGAADPAAREAAAQAAAQGFQVSVLGLGTSAGAFHRDRGGQLRRAALQGDALRAVAAAGGGRYATLAAGDADLQALGVLQPGAGELVSDEAQGARSWLDQGYWLLPPLLLLAAFGFRRGGRTLALGLLAILLLPASIAPAQAAEGSLWRRPDQLAQRQAQAGVDAYRQGDFAAAQRAFEGQQSAEAQYNLGNALARQGRYDEAIAAYDRALAERADMADAKANRDVVDAARRRQQQQQGGGPPSGEGDKDEDDGEAGQQGRPADDAAGDPSQRQPEAAEPPPEEPGADDGERQEQQRGEPPQEDAAEAARRQAQADADQRERMRQALEAGDADAGPDADPAQAAASAQQREQQQAREAWLRRVPDDPGGLLRAKFQIEQERRRREGR